MKIYIKSSYDESYDTMNDDRLQDLYIDIIDEREGVEDFTEEADYLDEAYWDVSNEIGRRKAQGVWSY